MKKFALCSLLFALCACAGASREDDYMPVATPSVDYVENLDVYAASHKDSFLNQLAMNYRSYAIFNARTSGYPDIGEQFAQKSIAAFSGETPFPEDVANWNIEDNDLKFDLTNACNELADALKNDAADLWPELTAEAQAKYDCWLSASASGQVATADECRARFDKAIAALDENFNGCDSKIAGKEPIAAAAEAEPVRVNSYYPETAGMRSLGAESRARDAVVIVNNINVPQNLIQPAPILHAAKLANTVNVPQNLIQPVPVPAAAQPMVFNQNIYGGHSLNEVVSNCIDDKCQEIPQLGDEMVSRDEFINMMMALRGEIAEINRRLDNMPVPSEGGKTILKVQQIPLEPKQHVMEEIFEIRFDFNKAIIKPEYEEVIRKLVATTRENRNVKISVVGHTDTVGSDAYNYALGGRRAEAVRQMLVQHGIPKSQIVAVSSGKIDPKIPTGDQVKNDENRRVRVVKEVHFKEPARAPQTKVEILEIPESESYGPREEENN